MNQPLCRLRLLWVFDIAKLRQHSLELRMRESNVGSQSVDTIKFTRTHAGDHHSPDRSLIPDRRNGNAGHKTRRLHHHPRRHTRRCHRTVPMPWHPRQPPAWAGRHSERPRWDGRMRTDSGLREHRRRDHHGENCCRADELESGHSLISPFIDPLQDSRLVKIRTHIQVCGAFRTTRIFFEPHSAFSDSEFA